ncbi:MAG: hypothetical protein ABEL76_00755 [Bradymonadaceae bacterium]
MSDGSERERVGDRVESQSAKAEYAGSGPVGTEGDAETAIEKEVYDEMASSLRRQADRIRRYLDELDRLGGAIDAETSRDRLEELVAEYNELRRRAIRARKDYRIQREAIGFYRNGVVREQFPVPPKRRVPGPHGEDGSVGGKCD